MSDPLITPGREHIVDAYGCRESSLQSKETVQRLVARILAEMRLRVIGEPMWHVFPGPGGLTGLVMLAESHLSVHTFPEQRYAAVNLYCCRPTADWAWDANLQEMLGAERVVVRTLVRAAAAPPDAALAGLRPAQGAVR